MLSKINSKMLMNALGFQVVWFICVQGNNLYAVIATVILLALHTTLYRDSLKIWPILIAFSLLGFLGDSGIAWLLNITYTDHLQTLAPLWLMCLWAAFATTMHHSMKWLFKSPFIAFVTGLLLVPLSYIAGINLSGSSLAAPYWQFFMVEGLWWGVLLVGYQRFFSVLSDSEVQNA